MRKLEKYQCEFCRTEYAKKQDAEACERNHKTVATIVSERHISRGQNGSGYPVAITVKMSDGVEQTFKR